jgi:hypothetical protein
MMLQNASFQTTRPQWLDPWADFAVTARGLIGRA